MGGALRRPANSGIGANLQNCSNLFYQKLLIRAAPAAARKRGLRGKGIAAASAFDRPAIRRDS